MLAVTHEATLTGAPMNLTHLLRWVRRETDVEVHTLVLQDGPLRRAFEEVGEVTLLDRTWASKLLRIAHRGLVHLGSSRAYKPVARAHLAPQLRALEGFEVVYLNSLPSVAVLPHLPEAGTVVSHVHELQVAMRTWAHTPEYDLFRTRPDLWVAASHAVGEMLTDEIGLPAERVTVHHEFIDANGLAQRSFDLRRAAALRARAGLPAGAAVVVGAGTLEWRKGPELFVQLAAEVRRRSRDRVAFIWVGGRRAGVEWERVRSDVERSGADVRFVGVQSDPHPWFALADVFALTSHEDPFPLVCLESAAVGTPVVTFRNGGMPELLDAAGPEAARGVVDHLDVGSMADHVIRLLEDDELRRDAADQLRERVVKHHDVTVAAPALFEDVLRAHVARGAQLP